jgi:hypothetical protein
MLVAYGETGATYKATAWNKTASEVQASRDAWNGSPSLAADLLACGHGGIDAWAIGSGGEGGRLVPLFGRDMLRGGLTCDPQLVFDMDHSIVSLIINAHALQQWDSWHASDHTVGALRVGYYGPGLMDNPPADRIAKYERHAKAFGAPGGAAFVRVQLAEFPSPSHAPEMLAQAQAVR